MAGDLPAEPEAGFGEGVAPAAHADHRAQQVVGVDLHRDAPHPAGLGGPGQDADGG